MKYLTLLILAFILTSQVTSAQYSRISALEVENPSGEAGDLFGTRIAVHKDYMAIGAPLADQRAKKDCGAVYLYRKVSGKWELKQEIFASDSQAGAWFGMGLDLQHGRLLVGAPKADANGIRNAGNVYILTIKKDQVTEDKKVPSPNPQSGSKYGQSVAWAYGSNPTPSNQFAVGARTENLHGHFGHGNVYLFDYNHTSKNALARTFNISEYHAQAHLGTVVKFGAGGVLIGIPNYSTPTKSHQGAVLHKQIFNNQSRLLLASDAEANDEFGSSLGTDVSHVYIGSPNKKIGNNEKQGAVYNFGVNIHGAASEVEIITDAEGNAGDKFGVSIDGANYRLAIASANTQCNSMKKYGAIHTYKVHPNPSIKTVANSYKKYRCEISPNKNSLGNEILMTDTEFIVSSMNETVDRKVNQGNVYTIARK